MITYVVRNSWTNLRTGKQFENLWVHHSSKQTFRYGPVDKVPETVKEFLKTAKLDRSENLPGDGIKTNRKYELFVKP